MSGTSLDGIDVALVGFAEDGIQLQGTYFKAYPPALKDALLTLHHPTHDELNLTQLISNELARLYAAATATLLQKTGISSTRIRAIGCHGQTLRHQPGLGYTLQLGNAALLAELSGITVVSDFRSRDIAAGGQGAPLVPAFHERMLRHVHNHRVIVNIGGISNLTDLAPGRVATGFDCGPGNLLMDAWIARHQAVAYDRDGAWAASGTVLPALLHKLMQEPFLRASPPKSCGRDLFNLAWLDKQLQGDEPPQDVQATLLAFSAQAVADAVTRHCSGAQEIYLCGGGAHNHALIEHLCAAMPGLSVQPTDTLGMPGDWLEAITFAWLARQAIHTEPTDLCAVTGARHPCILGAIHQA